MPVSHRRLSFRFTIKYIEGTLHFNIRVNQPDRYAIGFQHQGNDMMIYLYIFKQNGPVTPSVPVDWGEFIDYGHGRVEVVAEGGNIYVYVATGKDPVITYSDPEALPPGTLAFEIVDRLDALSCLSRLSKSGCPRI